MKNTNDLHNLFEELSSPRLDLPVHQKALRASLLNKHAPKQTFMDRFLSTFTIKKVSARMYMNKKVVAFGLPALVIGVFAMGIIAFSGSHNTVSAAEILEGAAKSANQMSQAEIDTINRQYQQDLNQRLSEAKTSKSLKILQEQDLQQWGIGKSKDNLKTYLGYVDATNHRIVIGLDENDQPRVILDVDAAPAGDAVNPTPTMQVN